MNEERDQRLAKLFENATVELNGDELAARIRRRIKRETTIAHVRKVAMLLALVGIGVVFSDQINKPFIETQASIEQVLAQYVAEYETIGKVAVALLVIGFIVRRRIRRWI
jgi:predicted exporter